MWTIVIFAVCLYLYGAYRSLALFLGVISTIIALGLTLITSLLLTMFFDYPTIEAIKVATLGNWWTTEFVRRPEFTLSEALIVPAIFLGDLLRVYARLVMNHTNVFFLGAAVFCTWLWFKTWQIVYFVFARYGRSKTNEA